MNNADNFRGNRLRVQAVAKRLSEEGYAVRRYTWWHKRKGDWSEVRTRDMYTVVYAMIDDMYPAWYSKQSSKYLFYREVADVLRVPVEAPWPPN